MTYNIYFGTIGKTLGVKYRFSTNCKNELEATNIAKEQAIMFYTNNEGKHGIPTFSDVIQESKYLDNSVSIETLYKDHIDDMMRWYAIPTDCDTISSKELKWL